MSDGTLFKPDKDFSKDADRILPEAESLAKVISKIPLRNLKLIREQGDLQRGIDKILALEKQARQVCPKRRSHAFSLLTSNLGFRSCYNLEMFSRYRHTM
jgi:26S proteasome regulatory subunit N5